MGGNELSVNCVENGIKTIYAGGWEKHAWYRWHPIYYLVDILLTRSD